MTGLEHLGDHVHPPLPTTLPAGAIAHPTGAADVVIRMATGGGFVPIEYNYTMVPEFTIYGDGRIIVTGPTTLEYPGKALPNLQTTVVSEEVLQAMLAAAKEAKLFQNGVDYGTPGVTDVGTTTITINADNTTYTAQIYALGFEDGGNLTMEQQTARAAISASARQAERPVHLRPGGAGLGVLRLHGPQGLQPGRRHHRQHRPHRHPAQPSPLAARRSGHQRQRGGERAGSARSDRLR